MRGARKRAATARGRASYRSRLKARARDFYHKHAIWAVQRMSLIAPAEREWRIRLITGADDRSLTGILMGDPQFLRSALYFHTLKETSHG